MLKKAFGNIKDKDSYWYKMAVRSEKNRIRQQKKEKKDKLEFQKKMKWVFILTILALVIYFSNSWYRSYTLNRNGIETIAIIENIIHDSHRISDLDRRYVDHYFVSYRYKANKKWRKGMSEINANKYTYYLGDNAIIGDTIRLKYLNDSPSTIELIKLKKD